MLWLIGVKPPVINAEIDTHSEWSTARVGDMPDATHSAVITAAESRMNDAAIREMNWVVCTTLGTTCSLRPSEENRLAPPAFPNSPNDNPTTTRPKPPMACITKRHMSH